MAVLEVTTHKTRYGVPIPQDQAALEPFLFGPTNETRQFFVNQGETFCVRATCDGCTLAQGCEFKEDQVLLCFNPTTKQPLAQPHPRRSVGYEQRQFWPLIPKAGISDEQLIEAGVPEHHIPALKDDEHFTGFFDPIPYPYAERPLRVVRNMIRWYGTEEELAAHPISQVCNKLPPFVPGIMVPHSLDFSSIEPLVNTIVTREQQWLTVFNGYSKETIREIAIDNDMAPPAHTLSFSQNQLTNPERPAEGTKYYLCHLNDELSKTSFEKMCPKCPVKDHCRTLHSIYKIAKDSWHDINLKFLYSDRQHEWNKPDGTWDGEIFKHYRGITKIVGLAITYGGSAWTVSANMNETVQQAEVRVERFLAGLPTFRSYMEVQKAKVLMTGEVFSIFGRRRDVRYYSHPDPEKFPNFKERKKMQGYAQRTSLNHPIQSSAGDLLKMVTNRVSQMIRDKGYSPLFGFSLPPKIDVYNPPPTLLATFLSVHDETDYLIDSRHRDEMIAEVYKQSQLEDVLRGFGVDFSLELDVEYDATATWTGKVSHPTARVYAVWHRDDPSQSPDMPRRPTETIVLNRQTTPANFLAELSQLVSSFSVSTNSQALPLVLSDGQFEYPFDKPVPIVLLRERGIPYIVRKT